MSGYLLLHREKSGLRPLVVDKIAMALHFMIDDFGLRQDRKDHYDTAGRRIIGGAVLLVVAR